MNVKSSIGIAVCTFEIGTSVPSEIQLTPDGVFRARDGRPEGIPGWVINEQIAANVIARASTNVNKTVIDYEHQTLLSEENGKPAPAAGWYREMEWRPGVGLFAINVDWTEAAKAAIASKEYLYISPVIAYDKITGEVTAILMAALTNFAAIDGMQELEALAAASFSLNTNQETDSMNKALLELLGLKEGASDKDIEDATAALATRLEKAEESEETIASLTTKVETQAAALAAKGNDEPDPSKYVPVAAMREVQAQLTALSTKFNDKEVDDLVNAALDEGKLLPKQEEWARKLGDKDIAELRSYLDSAQPIPGLKRRQTTDDDHEQNDGELTEEELAVCSATGINPEDYKKTKTETAA